MGGIGLNGWYLTVLVKGSCFGQLYLLSSDDFYSFINFWQFTHMTWHWQALWWTSFGLVKWFNQTKPNNWSIYHINELFGFEGLVWWDGLTTPKYIGQLFGSIIQPKHWSVYHINRFFCVEGAKRVSVDMPHFVPVKKTNLMSGDRKEKLLNLSTKENTSCILHVDVEIKRRKTCVSGKSFCTRQKFLHQAMLV